MDMLLSIAAYQSVRRKSSACSRNIHSTVNVVSGVLAAHTSTKPNYRSSLLVMTLVHVGRWPMSEFVCAASVYDISLRLRMQVRVRCGWTVFTWSFSDAHV